MKRILSFFIAATLLTCATAEVDAGQKESATDTHLYTVKIVNQFQPCSFVLYYFNPNSPDLDRDCAFAGVVYSESIINSFPRGSILKKLMLDTLDKPFKEYEIPLNDYANNCQYTIRLGQDDQPYLSKQ